MKKKKKTNGIVYGYRLGSLYFHSQNDAIDVLMEKGDPIRLMEEERIEQFDTMDNDFLVSSLFTDIVFLRNIDVKVLLPA